MSLRTLKQLADGVMGLLLAGTALALVGTLFFTGQFDRLEIYVGILFFGGMAALCFRDFSKRRRADRRGFDVIAPDEWKDAGT